MTSKTRLEQTKRFVKDLKTCIECGNCTFWCPVYMEEPAESSVARGKIMMIRELLSQKMDYTDQFGELLGKCMLCMTCSEHCPVGCQVQSTVLASKADKVETQGIGLLSALIYRGLIPRRRLFGNVVRVASWLQKILFPKTEGRIRHLPLFLSSLGKGRQIPSIAPRFLRQLVPEVNRPPEGVKTRMRIGYFVGCATDFIFPEIGQKTIDFLTRNGVEVIVPKRQGCCGAPVWVGSGDFKTGRRMADVNAGSFSDVDYVITACATCASTLKEYVKYLADSPERTKAFGQLAEKTRDVVEFIVDILKLPPSAFHASPDAKGKKITWHAPCHSHRYLGIKEQPVRLLRSIPEVEYLEMTRADRCCGMAGSFSIHHYDLSKKIADRKAESIQSTGADLVATSCPGCMIQLIDTMKRHRMPQRVLHVMELLK
jgi:glycolate oxidase iron-sulfur subunit